MVCEIEQLAENRWKCRI